MLLAGDVGGTKTLLGLFEPGPARPIARVVRAFSTLDYPDLIGMIADFARAEPAMSKTGAFDAACFGVAGPVIGGSAELTNVPWRVDARAVADAFGIRPVSLLNDLQAMAYAVPVLEEPELHTLQAGVALGGGNIALIAAGTGLGESLLHSVDGRFIPSPCEGGHADFPARNEREIALLRALIQRFGRASVEHVVSGRGLVNVHRVTHAETPCAAVADIDDPLAPAAISTAALDRRCPGCTEALEMFVEAYGAEAGNLALRSVSTGGLFVGGGIAPKILPALIDGRFMHAFREKPPFREMLSAMPVKMILNAEAGLLGAAVYAANA
jgi:glucokinase